MNIRVPHPGSPDESHRQQSIEQKRREAQRVKEVEAVDADEQAKRWKTAFQQAQEPDETEDNAPAAQAQPPPSIFDTSFNSTTKTGISTDGAIPSPSYSPSPDLMGLEPEAEDFLSSSDLPQSEAFYEGYNLPDQPLETPQFQQVEPEQPMAPEQPMTKGAGQPTQSRQPGRPQPMQGKHPTKEEHKKGFPEKKPTPMAKKEVLPETMPRGPASLARKKEQQLEPSPFGPPGKPVKEKPGVSIHKKEEKPGIPKKTEKEALPTAKYWGGEETIPVPGKPTFKSEKEKLPPKKTESLVPTEHKTAETKKPSPKPFEPIFEKAEGKRGGEKESGGEEKGRERGGKTIEITAPSLPTLPADVQPTAQAAAVNAAPYLRPEILPIFYQMIGNIFVMTSPKGISHTEFLLNNPAFSNSKFYGSSIEITRYSTAPDSFNIRLSGTTEAVDAFNQNIPSLVAAFHTGGHKFRIGRIDTEYRTEKPVLRRKEGGREKGEKGEKE